MTLKVSSVSLEHYGNTPDGNVNLYDDGSSHRIKLTSDEANELIQFAITIFQRRQAEIADKIAKYQPPLLASPDAVDAEFTSVDDIPF